MTAAVTSPRRQATATSPAVEGLYEITVTVAPEDGSRTKVHRAALAAAGRAMDCLRDAVAAGFSLGVHERGSVDGLVSCAEGSHITALYAPHEGEYAPLILSAPAPVNAPFRELFPGAVPAPAPAAVRGEAPATETDSNGGTGR